MNAWATNASHWPHSYWAANYWAGPYWPKVQRSGFSGGSSGAATSRTLRTAEDVRRDLEEIDRIVQDIIGTNANDHDQLLKAAAALEALQAVSKEQYRQKAALVATINRVQTLIETRAREDVLRKSISRLSAQRKLIQAEIRRRKEDERKAIEILLGY